jgi:hypothetical protein
MWRWFLLLLLAGPIHADSWHEVARRTHQQGLTLSSQLPKGTWGGDMAEQDLQLLLGALDVLQGWGQGADQPLSREVLHDTRSTLGRYCQRLRLSLSTLPDPQPSLDWLRQVERLDRQLLSVENSFGGYHLPTQQQLAQSSFDRNWALPGYQDPPELMREARSIRLDVLSITSPFVYPGNGLGGLGLGYGAGWPGGAELQDLMVAASRYESVCNSPYEDVVQTRRAYERLQTAFDRMWPGALNNSASLRNVSRALDRLERFYKATELP